MRSDGCVTVESAVDTIQSYVDLVEASLDSIKSSFPHVVLLPQGRRRYIVCVGAGRANRGPDKSWAFAIAGLERSQKVHECDRRGMRLLFDE